LSQGKDLTLQLAEQDIHDWCAKFEARGHRALENAVQQIREMNMQRRELDAQRDRTLDQSMTNFNAKVIARVEERERRMRVMAESFHAFVRHFFFSFFICFVFVVDYMLWFYIIHK
jgi:hypothetical protein